MAKLTGGTATTNDGGLLGVRLKADGLKTQLRSTLGQFTSMQGKVLTAHRAMALRLAAGQINELQAAIEGHRRAGVQRSSRYLLKAMESDDYIVATKEGFIVNPAGYLDSSPAGKYWRHIESGYEGFVGDIFYGFFRTGAKTRGPSLARDTELLQSISTFGRHGEGNLGTASNPVQLKIGRSVQLANGQVVGAHEGRGERKNKGFLIEIKNPIPAYSFLARGILDWRAAVSPRDYYIAAGIPIR